MIYLNFVSRNSVSFGLINNIITTCDTSKLSSVGQQGEEVEWVYLSVVFTWHDCVNKCLYSSRGFVDLIQIELFTFTVARNL